MKTYFIKDQSKDLLQFSISQANFFGIRPIIFLQDLDCKNITNRRDYTKSGLGLELAVLVLRLDGLIIHHCL